MKNTSIVHRPATERPASISIRPLDKKETTGMPYSNGNGA